MFYYIDNNSIDNFADIGRVIYKGAEDHILSEQELKEQFKEELYKDTTIYEGESTFMGYPIRENNTIRTATRLELINMGYQELKDGEYIENNEIKSVPRPDYHYKWDKETHTWIVDESTLKDGEYVENNEIKRVHRPADMLRPIWNKETHVWEEDASETEINLTAAKTQYDEYKPMDTPLTFEMMEEQGILQDYKSMMKELQNIILTLTVSLEEERHDTKTLKTMKIALPVPSDKLVAFKNKFNKL